VGARAAHWLTLTAAALGSLSLAHAQTFNERFAALDLSDNDPVALSGQPGFISAPRARTEEVFRGVRINPPEANGARAPQGLVAAYASEEAAPSAPFDFWSPRLTPAGEAPMAHGRPSLQRPAAVMPTRRMFAAHGAAMAPVELPQQSATGPIYREVSPQQAHYIASKFRPKPVPANLEALIAEKAKKHGVPLQFAHAVVSVESNYNPNATGRGATIGLMQIKHPTARGMGFDGSVQQLYDPAANLEYGMKYLGQAHRLARGDTCGTIMRYQGGLRAVSMSADAVVYCAKVKRLLGGQGDTKRVAANGRTPPRGY
jgi:soluble lytic murein transglycosylase-like protein